MTTTTMTTSPADPTLVFSHTFDAPRKAVWKAWTDPAQVSRWWGCDRITSADCAMDLRPGGAWRVDMHDVDGATHHLEGEYLEVAEPIRLVHTQRWGDAAPSTVTVTFDADGSATRVTEELHFTSAADRDAALACGMEDGAAQSYDRLARFLAER